ncbi:MAG: PadR family transcriptional regulator [Dactylosporangium sp.]|nr:PadR family transcriptional regulator [Dactylosporangium sp.]NNJ59819.1 PadR family transcriptional regulator [Dactylosporangium sp.]
MRGHELPGGCGRGQHAPGCCARRGGRAKRGKIREAVLVLLAERPMHGYEMITELEKRTGGGWTPSPGSIYPALQVLTDDGLVVCEADGGRRRYALTEAGRPLARELAGASAPWAGMLTPTNPVADGLRGAVTGLDAALLQVLDAGTPQQQIRAREVLVEARRAIYRVLAEGE